MYVCIRCTYAIQFISLCRVYFNVRDVTSYIISMFEQTEVGI